MAPAAAAVAVTVSFLRAPSCRVPFIYSILPGHQRVLVLHALHGEADSILYCSVATQAVNWTTTSVVIVPSLKALAAKFYRSSNKLTGWQSRLCINITSFLTTQMCCVTALISKHMHIYIYLHTYLHRKGGSSKREIEGGSRLGRFLRVPCTNV